MSIERKSFFVNLEPITILGIKTHQKQIFRIYTGKNDRVPEFVAVAETLGGCSLGTIFKKSQTQWIGKVGNPRGAFRNDPLTIRSRGKKEISLDTICEKLAYDLYKELARGLFFVPKSRLSLQPIMDQFNKTHPLALHWISQGILDSLRIMSCFVDGYQNFQSAKTKEKGETISFMECIRRYHRPPETLLTPEGKAVPLKGMISLLAVARCLADTDVLGGSGGNAGFRWVKDEKGIQAAEAVKIDPGESFKFTRDPALEEVSINWVINTKEHLGHPDYHLKDRRDLQTSNHNRETAIVWTALTPSQQEEFLATLFNSSRYLRSQAVLHFLFYREGAFNRSETECIPEEIAKKLASELQEWMKQQLEIYAADLKEFKEKHPEELIRVHYIDNWGELSLPMAEETFPIRELFTNNQIVKEEEKSGIFSNSNQAKMDFENSHLMPVFPEKRSLKLEEIFYPLNGKKPQKLLLTGSSGIGKSTLCQKIAHDWASGRLWNDYFDMVYWLPLRELNIKNLPMDNLAFFLAQAIYELILKEEIELSAFLSKFKENSSRSLILLDGYDEATPHLKQVIARLFQEKELIIFLTARPGGADSLHSYLDLKIESIGFGDEQIENYTKQFFSRGNSKKDHHPFLHAIKTSPNLLDLARNPLHLQMLCSLWEKKKEGVASGLTGLYAQMIDQVLIWNAKKFKSLDRENILPLLGIMGLIYQERGLQSISDQILDQSFQGTRYTKQDLLWTGFFKETTKGRYSFLHLSFQEYFAALALTCQSFEEQKTFILKHWDDVNCRPIFTFLCGMIFNLNLPSHTGESALVFFFETLHRQSSDQLSKKERFKLTFRCLAECPNDFKRIPFFDNYLEEAFSSIHAAGPNENFILFQDAVLEGNIEMLQWLGSKDPSIIGKVAEGGITFLHRAAGRGRLKIAEWLCSKHPSLIGRYTTDGRTPLHSAVSEGHIEMAEWLCSKDPSLIGKYTTDGWTPLHAAVSIKIAEWLCSKDPSLIRKYAIDGVTPLHAAVSRGNIQMAEWLCSKDPSLIRKYMTNGITPLYSAVFKGDIQMAEWLCSKNPSLIGKYATDGTTPLHIAAGRGRIEMAEWLCSKDPSLIEKYTQDGMTPLYSAILGGSVEMAKWLHSKDPSIIGKYTYWGITPLHMAILKGDLDIIEWICSADPKQLFIKFYGTTPFALSLHKVPLMSFKINPAVRDWLQANYPEACSKPSLCILL